MKKLLLLSLLAISACLTSCSYKGIATNSYKEEMYANQDFMANARSVSEPIAATVISDLEPKGTMDTKKVKETPIRVKSKLIKYKEASFIVKLKKEGNSQIAKEIKEPKSNNTDKKFSVGAKILLVLLALFLPFVSVLIVDGGDIHFWLSLLFTILGFIPGLLYAIIRIFRH